MARYDEKGKRLPTLYDISSGKYEAESGTWKAGEKQYRDEPQNIPELDIVTDSIKKSKKGFTKGVGGE